MVTTVRDGWIVGAPCPVGHSRWATLPGSDVIGALIAQSMEMHRLKPKWPYPRGVLLIEQIRA